MVRIRDVVQGFDGVISCPGFPPTRHGPKFLSNGAVIFCSEKSFNFNVLQLVVLDAPDLGVLCLNLTLQFFVLFGKIRNLSLKPPNPLLTLGEIIFKVFDPLIPFSDCNEILFAGGDVRTSFLFEEE